MTLDGILAGVGQGKDSVMMSRVPGAKVALLFSGLEASGSSSFAFPWWHWVGFGSSLCWGGN